MRLDTSLRAGWLPLFWWGLPPGFLGTYPLLRVLLITVSPLRRGTFSKRRKSTQKGLLLRSALAGSGSFAAGSIRAQRLRFASLHLLPLCLAAPDGRYAPTPGSIPPLSLPTSPVDQDQKHSSLRSLLSGAASPRQLRCFAFVGASLLAKAFCQPPPYCPTNQRKYGFARSPCITSRISRPQASRSPS